MDKQKPRKDFRVIIVGGSIAGLTLAHSLRKYNIDYVVLESHGDIAPQVGASIGFVASGCGILDQLGVFEDIRKEIEPLKTTRYWTETGKVIAQTEGPVIIHERHGYPISFLDRQKVLAVLYDHLAEDKAKVMLNTKAVQVEHTATSAIVHCTDGSQWTGDVVVGADGVHSTIRSEIWNRMETQQLSHTVAREKDEMISEYSCVFGISTATEGLKAGDMHRTFCKDFSTLTIVGKNDRVFWFFFAKMDRKYTLGNIPRFTPEDQKQHTSKYLHINITSDVLFRDVYDNVVSTAYVPLEEAFYKHWTWDRMVCIGDSIHKMTPNMGQGGNTAVETAASLANCFRKFIDAAPDSSYSMNDLHAALAAWAVARKPRAKHIWAKANDLTRLEAWATLRHKLTTYYLLPYMSRTLIDRACVAFIGTEVLEYLPIPKVSQECPMPADRRYRNVQQDPSWKRLLWSVSLVVCFVGACVAIDIEPVKTHIHLMTTGDSSEAVNGEGFHYRKILSTISGSDPISRLQMLSFLADLGALYVIWLLEAYRHTHSGAAVLLPVLMGIASQVRGSGKVAPLYFLLDFLQSPLQALLVGNRASIRLSALKTLLPALIVASYLPSWACFVAPTFSDKQLSRMIWQFFPLLVPVTQMPLFAIARMLPRLAPASKGRRPDMPYVRLTIILFTIISGAVFSYVRLTAPENVFLSDIFLPSIDYNAPVDSFAAALRRFLQYDQVFAMASGLVWVLLSFRDLQVYGIDTSLFKVALVLTVATLTLGPGAAFAVGWAWREEYLAAIRG